MTIQNCYLDTVNRWGIAVGYTYEWAKFNGGALSDETMKTYASSDVVIQNNYLNNVRIKDVKVGSVKKFVKKVSNVENVVEKNVTYQMEGNKD